jgi:hypothetical protein
MLTLGDGSIIMEQITSLDGRRGALDGTLVNNDDVVIVLLFFQAVLVGYLLKGIVRGHEWPLGHTRMKKP